MLLYDNAVLPRTVVESESYYSVVAGKVQLLTGGKVRIRTRDSVSVYATALGMQRYGARVLPLQAADSVLGSCSCAMLWKRDSLNSDS